MSDDELRRAEVAWADDLARWAIPPEILQAAPESPWGFPVARFAGRADRALRERSGASFEQTAAFMAEVGPGRASLLDVGAGAGAGSLPHAAESSSVTAVDENREMLDAFDERAAALGVSHRSVLGEWPGIASQVPVHDVVVAHHVVYNVASIGPFLRALTARAAVGVVLELPPGHPTSWMTPLWLQFHGLDRPTTPTSNDLYRILQLQGVASLKQTRWVRHDPAAADGSDSESLDERAALVTRRLCLPPARSGEVAEALRQMPDEYQRDVVTMSWRGEPGREKHGEGAGEPQATRG